MVVSTSTIHGSGFLEYIRNEIKTFIQTDEILFVPYAKPGGISFDDYTQKVQDAVKELGIKVSGIHEFENQKQAIQNAKSIFTGGGNTFLLLKTLYGLDLINTLRDQILSGTPYIGTSAGSNITGQTIGTTNDMPIVYLPSFDALGILPFNLNPHFLEADPNSTHKGETREQRIEEFLSQNDLPVIGLKEGSWLEVINGDIVLKGNLNALLFKQNHPLIYLETNESVKKYL